MYKNFSFPTILILCLFSIILINGHSQVNQHPAISGTTIEVNSNPTVTCSIDQSTVTKISRCIVSNEGKTETTVYELIPDKVHFTVSGNVLGYGSARPGISSCDLNGVSHGSSNKIVSVGSKTDGAPSKPGSAEYDLVPISYTYKPSIRHEAIGSGASTWNASGTIEVSHYEWYGSGTVSITATTAASVQVGTSGLSATQTYSVSAGTSTTVTAKISGQWAGTTTDASGPFTGDPKFKCGHSSCDEEISGLHDHHINCGQDNPDSPGCGELLQCENHIPDWHEPHASCWNVQLGCPETNVRRCSHACTYGSGSGDDDDNGNGGDDPDDPDDPLANIPASEDIAVCERRTRCEIEGYTYLDDATTTHRNHYIESCGDDTAAGCGDDWWQCKSSDVDEHGIRYCTRTRRVRRRDNFGNYRVVTQVCGKPYRKCTNPRGKCFDTGHPKWSRHKGGTPSGT